MHLNLMYLWRDVLGTIRYGTIWHDQYLFKSIQIISNQRKDMSARKDFSRMPPALPQASLQSAAKVCFQLAWTARHRMPFLPVHSLGPICKFIDLGCWLLTARFKLAPLSRSLHPSDKSPLQGTTPPGVCKA